MTFVLLKACWQGQWDAALRRIQEFGLGRRLLSPRLQRLKVEGGTGGHPGFWLGIIPSGANYRTGVTARAMEGGIEVLVCSERPLPRRRLREWRAALRGSRPLVCSTGGVCRGGAAAGVRRLLQQGQSSWEAALRGIRAFWPAAGGVCRGGGCGGATVAPAGAVGRGSAGHGTRPSRGIQAFRLQREAFAEAAAKGVWRLVQQAQYEAAVTGARHFHVWDLLHDYLADRIHADREKKSDVWTG
jgi:hypothetical protein